MRLTNGFADVLPSQPFQIIVANFTWKDRYLPKHTILGYAKRNPVAILRSECIEAERIGQIIYIINLAEEVPALAASFEGDA